MSDYTPTTIQVTTAPTFSDVGSQRSFSLLQLCTMLAKEKPVDTNALARSLGRVPESKEIKAAGPIMYWATWPQMNPSPKQRSLAACTGITAVWLDYDARSGNTLSRPQFEERVEMLELECLTWNTFSADQRQLDFRAVFPLSKPITPAQHPVLFAALMKALGDDLHPPAKESETCTQGTFIAPRQGGAGNNPEIINGRPIDVVLDVDYSEVARLRTLNTQFAGSTGAGITLDRVFNELQKELYLRLISVIDSHPRDNWLKVCGAGLRGWCVDARRVAAPESMTPQQRDLVATLEAWCKDNEHVPQGAKAKYRPNTMLKNTSNILKGNKAAGLPSVAKLAQDSGADLSALVSGDAELLHLLNNCLDAPIEVEPVVSEELVRAAVTENHLKIEAAERSADQYERQIQSLILDMPDGTAKDYIVSVATKGQVNSFSELNSMSQLKLHPAMAILSGLQIADTVMGNRVWLNTGDFGTLAGNLYVLALASSGTGKSQTLDFISDVLYEANYGQAFTNGKSHSGGGFYNNFLMRGPVVFQASDEAKDWLSCMEVSGGGMVSNQTSLNALILTLFNQSRLGGKVNPANLMSDRVNGKVRQVEPVRQPHVNILFIGTHELKQSLSDKLIEDGYLARFIILDIPDEDDPEMELRRKVECQFGDGSGRHIYHEGVKNVAKFLRDLDVELSANFRGKSASSLREIVSEFVDDEAGDDGKTMGVLFTEMQNERIDEDHWCSLLNMDRDVGEVLIQSGLPLVRAAKANPVLNPISNREVEKIQRVALILSVLNNPAADKLDLDMVKFAAKLVQLLQKPWIDELSKGEVSLVSKSNTFYPLLDKLRRELGRDRPLYRAASGLTANELRDTSRVWRDIIRATNSAASGLRDDAVKILELLGVYRVKIEGRKGFVFFHPDHAPQIIEEV